VIENFTDYLVLFGIVSTLQILFSYKKLGFEIIEKDGTLTPENSGGTYRG
jgi:hypothetical protein